MKTSDAGRVMIEGFEGLRLNSYQDQRGIWTVGYGSTTDVYANMTITQQDADARLAIDLHHAETAVITGVKVSTTQNMFDALVSLVYNIGGGAFSKSTLLSLLNQGAKLGAAAQFLVWSHTNGVVNQGLIKRRIAERDLFMKPEAA